MVQLLLLLWVNAASGEVNPQAVIEGRVFGHPGFPYKGRVTFSTRTKTEGVLDSSGSFSITISSWESIASGRVILEIDGAAPIEIDDVIPVPGETIDVGVYELTRGGAVGGRVVDPEGNPLSDYRVFLITREDLSWHSDFYPMVMSTKSNQQGRFQFPSVGVRRHSLESGKTFVHNVVPGQGEALICVESFRVLKGRIVDTEKIPIRGAQVSFDVGVERFMEIPKWFTRTDDRGFYDLKNVAQADGTLCIDVGSDFDPKRLKVELSSDESVEEEYYFIRKRARPPLSIKGIVHTRSGQPIHRAWLSCSGVRSLTDEEGRFEFDAQIRERFGSLRVDGGKEGVSNFSFDGDREFDITLPGSGRIQFRFEPDDVLVSIYDSAAFGGERSAYGSFETAPLPPGAYSPMIDAPGYRRKRYLIDVKAGEISKYLVRLEPSDEEPICEGRVIENGEPVFLRRVFLSRMFLCEEGPEEYHREERFDVAETLTNENGEYRLRLDDRPLRSHDEGQSIARIASFWRALDEVKLGVDAPPHPSDEILDFLGGMISIPVPSTGDRFLKTFDFEACEVTLTVKKPDGTPVKFANPRLIASETELELRGWPVIDVMAPLIELESYGFCAVPGDYSLRLRVENRGEIYPVKIRHERKQELEVVWEE